MATIAEWAISASPGWVTLRPYNWERNSKVLANNRYTSPSAMEVERTNEAQLS